MTTKNRLAKSEVQPTRTAQEWCDLGNDRLAGRIPYSDGEYRPRNDCKWVVENKQPRLVSIHYQAFTIA